MSVSVSVSVPWNFTYVRNTSCRHVYYMPLSMAVCSKTDSGPADQLPLLPDAAVGGSGTVVVVGLGWSGRVGSVYCAKLNDDD